jgi:aminoglycoside N3'-acetyltransferase
MLLEVHSSLSSLGHVDGGAATVINALMTVVGPNGGIVMPTFPVSAPLPLSDIDRERGVIFKIQKFDETSDARSGMGLIPDTFRKMLGVITGKGEHRVSAWGKDAEINADGLMNLIESGGYALLIGVDIYRLTSMHYMENKLPERIQMTYEASEEIVKYYPKDQWYIQTGSPPGQAWYKIQDEAYRRKLIREQRIGKSRCMFFRVNDVVRIYEKAIETDPFGLFGLSQ